MTPPREVRAAVVACDLLRGAGVFATPREASLSVTRPIHDGYLTVHRFPDYGQGRRRFVAIAEVEAFIAAEYERAA